MHAPRVKLCSVALSDFRDDGAENRGISRIHSLQTISSRGSRGHDDTRRGKKKEPLRDEKQSHRADTLIAHAESGGSDDTIGTSRFTGRKEGRLANS